MKKAIFIAVTVVALAFSCSTDPKTDVSAANKEVSALYHKLDPALNDSILTENFVGHQGTLFSWNREQHKGWIGDSTFKADSVIRQMAEGDMVATMFTRTMELDGDTVTIDGMQFKRFENGKIAEIWEYFDYRLVQQYMAAADSAAKE